MDTVDTVDGDDGVDDGVSAIAPDRTGRLYQMSSNSVQTCGIAVSVTPTPVLQRLSEALDSMSPQVRQAAAYVLDNPSEVAVTSLRAMADAAEVKPNTMVRMARAAGFDGYDDFREPFRSVVVDTQLSFPDRARFLQSINEGGRHGALLSNMVASALGNVETLFASIDADKLKAAADLLVSARRANILGVGTAKPLAENFAYVASMSSGPDAGQVAAIPVLGLAIDDVARMRPSDVLVAMTFSPYRTEIIEAVNLAAEQRVPVVTITDSWASPIVAPSSYAFVVPNESPLPFSSNVATVALLEVLLSFMVADSDDDVASTIDAFHANRRAAGIYTE